jgi:hypothetical protein
MKTTHRCSQVPLIWSLQQHYQISVADIRTMFLQQTHCGGLAAGANGRCGGVTASEIGNKKWYAGYW